MPAKKKDAPYCARYVRHNGKEYMVYVKINEWRYLASPIMASSDGAPDIVFSLPVSYCEDITQEYEAREPTDS